MSSSKRSVVWLFFDEVEGKRSQCKFCQALISFKGGNVCNMQRHLKIKHPGVLDGKQQVKPDLSTFDTKPVVKKKKVARSAPSLNKCAEESTMQSSKQFRVYKNEQIHQQLNRMIVKEYQPVSIVEDVEFKKFVNMLNPGYVLPSRKTISSSLIPQLYESVKEEIRASIRKASAVCVTTDLWTFRDTQSFMSVTAHFITEETLLNTALLECLEFSQNHTADNFHDDLQGIFVDWEIEEKIIAVVTDNTANIVSAVRKGNWRHLPCMAHSLNLVLQDALEEIKEVEQKCQSIVEYFSRSPSSTSKLNFVQNEMNLEPINLNQDELTGWNSTYDMLKRILVMKDSVVSNLALLNAKHISFNHEDWIIIERSCTILKLFADVTSDIAKENDVTLSKELVLVNGIRSSLREANVENDSQEIVRLISKLIDGLNKRFKYLDDNQLVLESTLLDPRCKKHAFASETIFNKAYKILSRNASAVVLPQKAALPETPSPATTTNQIWARFEEKLRTSTSVIDPTAASLVELDKYLQETYASLDTNPLNWWNDRKAIYPRLFEIMKKRLCIVATSVTSEKVLSKNGMLLSDRRNRISPSNVAQIEFLNVNLK